MTALRTSNVTGSKSGTPVQVAFVALRRWAPAEVTRQYLRLNAPPGYRTPIRRQQARSLETMEAKVRAAGRMRVRRRLLGKKPLHNAVA